jgi:hypothetical protein
VREDLGFAGPPEPSPLRRVLPKGLVGVSTDMKSRLAANGVLVVAVVLVASSCVLPGKALFAAKNPLPTASATLNWATIDLPRGSYCWQSGGQGECADSAGPDQLLNTGYLRPSRTAGGFDVKITFHAASQPTSFSVQLIQGPGGRGGPVDQSGPDSFSVGTVSPATSGVYVYVVTGTWAEGDVSFYLTLQLVPGIT